MEIIFDQSLEAFLKNVSQLLHENEASNNYLIGMMNGYINFPKQLKDLYLIRIVQYSKTVAVAVKIEESNLILSYATEDQLLLLATVLKKQNVKFPGIYAEKNTSERFINAWSNSFNEEFDLTMSHTLYKLENVNMPEMIGCIRVPMVDEADLIAQWMFCFFKDAQPPSKQKTMEEVDALVKKLISKSLVYILEVNREPVSMSVVSRPTQNGMSIGPVYTPFALRGNGYASMLVASLSQKILDSGKNFCVLYADVKNSVSNKIYQKIGYQKLEDWSWYTFKKLTS